ncbi:unnamed protein product, partial [Brachionus calyciflorus]
MIDFSKPTMMYDVLLIIENKKFYCNRAILSIWSIVFEIMFKSNIKEKESCEVYLMDKTYDDIHGLLLVIYPPNKRITLFADVVNRCSDHLMYTLTSTIITNDIKIKEVNSEIMNTVLISRIKHLESVIEKLIKKSGSACDKFHEIKNLNGNLNENLSTCSNHSKTTEKCQDCMRNNKIVQFDLKDTVSTVNNLLHSLFSQIDVTLNNTNLESTNNTYPYKAYITNLCNYGEDLKKSYLQSSLFYKDKNGKSTAQMENLNVDPYLDHNRGFFERREKFRRRDGSLELIGKPHLDILNTDKYLINNVELGFKFNRSKGSFCLLAQADSTYFIEIEKAILFIRKVTINPSIVVAHALTLERKNAIYPIKKTCVKPFSFAKDFSSQIISNINQGILPNRIVVSTVECESYNGSLTKNPFNFQNFDL